MKQAQATQPLEPTAPEGDATAEPLTLERIAASSRTGLHDATPRLSYGTVISDGELIVAFVDRTYPARRAKSCLVEAERGDRVLCALDGEVAWVLSVLDGRARTQVKVEGDLEVRAAGAVALGAATSVELSGDDISLVSTRLKLRAKQALSALDELKLLGRSVEVDVTDRAALFAERVEARATRFLQRAKRAFRFVEEVEQVRAGHVDVRAEGLAAVRGENTIVSARVLAKLDGEQVKIG